MYNTKSTLERIRKLVKAGDVRISEDRYDELAEDDIRVRDILDGIESSVVVEEYPEYPKGACVLVLQRDHEGLPIHDYGVSRAVI